MLELTTSQLVELFDNPTKWSYHEEVNINQEVIDQVHNGFDEEAGESEWIDVTKCFGNAFVTATASVDGKEISITYGEGFGFDKYNKDSFESYPPNDGNWLIQGFLLVDEDGEELESYELQEWLDEHHPNHIQSIDYTTLNINQTICADTPTETQDMTTNDNELITLDNDNAPNVKFQGELLADASNRYSKNPYNGETRWNEIYLYKTVGGNLVAQTVGRSQWQGEVDRYKVKVCKTEQEVIDFLGFSDSAKHIYKEAGISTELKVE